VDDRPPEITTIDGSPMARVELRVGDTIAGRYVVNELLGRGGMGTVYRVRDELLEEDVAVKVLDVAPSPASARRFRDEVRLARRITHINVARTHDLGEHAGRLFLTMECITGESLRDFIHREAPVDPRRAVRLAIAIADGLAAAHAANVVHRDLKPENVLLDRDDRAVLTDFGIASALTGDAHSPAMAVGTPLYMSPEQARAETVDARSDVFSLGLILYEMLSGEGPYTSASPIATVVERAEGPPRRIEEVAAVERDLADAVHACLAHAPNDRPADAAAAADLLSRLLASGSGEWQPMPLEDARPPATRGAPVVAVVPFDTPAGNDTLEFSTLCEEVVDALSCGRSVQVLAAGASQRFTARDDPRIVGEMLGATIVVQGRLEIRGDSLSFRSTISNGQTGAQELRVQVSVPRGGVEEQRVLVGKIANRLRAEVLTLVARRKHPPKAVDLYVEALAYPTGFRFDTAEETLSLLERSIALAPDFAMARAALATAALRAWFVPGDIPGDSPEHLVRDAVALAVQADNELPETQLAVARLAVQDGRWRAAAHSLRRALALMPSSSDGHAYLGLLQVEAGLVKQGLEHLRWSKALEPTNTLYDYELARQAALAGDLRVYDQQAAMLRETGHGLDMLFLELRTSAWYRRNDRIAELIELSRDVAHPAVPALIAHGEALLGQRTTAELEAAVAGVVVDPGTNPRFRVLGLQLLTETLALCGDTERALARLDETSRGPLVDVVWLDACPALAPLRESAVFLEVRRRLRGRCAAIWQA